jgi:uncharacterized membrane protein YgcG
MPVRRLLVVAALWLATLLVPAAASAEERILDYHSDIAVQPDSSLLVTETILVRAEGNRIRRGIYRDFPTRYKGARGSQVRVGFELLGVTRNGAREPAATEPASNGVRVRIGSQDVYLEPGEYRYSIRYRTTRQLGRFADFDELYWNVTGNGWVFPIDRVEARITLPSPATFGQRAVYTGPQGASGKQARVASERPGEILFRTTAPLAPYEGLTVAVAWPKGVVAGPSESDRRSWWLADNGPPLAGALALLGILGFYWMAWKRAGRDPRPGTVVPRFSPPDDLSPAAMRYVWKMGADNRAFAAALVDMGVKGHVRLVEEDGGWFSSDKTRIERLAGSGALAADEEAALRELAQTGESIVMEQKNHAKFSSAKKALSEILKDAYEGKLFNRNLAWAFAGLIIFIAGIWMAAGAVVALAGTGNLTMIGIALGALIVTVLLVLAMREFRTHGKCLLAIAAFLSGAVALAVGASIIPAALESGRWLPLALPSLALPVVISAFWWMSAPTLEGRAVLDRIAGFRQYLSIAERERLDRMTAPEDTPEIFERYLPYAIALGVENRWADRFRGVLAAAAVQGQAQGFAWYSGGGNPWDDTGSFVDDVGSSLASTISSASTAPGSSSGSGGGGSSGGGGGGGGGGGW